MGYGSIQGLTDTCGLPCHVINLAYLKTHIEWKKLHNEELNNLYYSPNIFRVIKSRKMRWAGRVARVGWRRGVYVVMVGKPRGKIPTGRPRRRWEGNIKTGVQEVGFSGMDWFDLAQDTDRWRAIVNAVTNPRVILNAGNFLAN